MAVGISARGVCFFWPGTGTPALADVNLDVAPGETVAVVGPNGAGKSTLLRVLTGFLRPSRGAVFVNGKNLRSVKRRDVARLISFVPQYSEVNLPYRVRDMVTLGRYPYLGPWNAPRAADREAVSRALTITGVAPLALRPVSQLSGGEFQRVVLARAFAQETPAILADEPTAHLDISHEVRILSLLRERNKELGTTVVCVIHDLNAAAVFFRRLILLANGRVVADGPPRQVLNSDNLTAAYGWPVTVTTLSGRPFVIPFYANN